MFTVLEEASKGVYHKTVVAKKEKSDGFEVEFKGDQPIAKGKKRSVDNLLSVHNELIGKLLISTNNEIILSNVPIVTPNCDVVCPSLSFSLKPGQHLLITGLVLPFDLYVDVYLKKIML